MSSGFIGNGVCDDSCMTEECLFDDGDCNEDTVCAKVHIVTTYIFIGTCLHYQIGIMLIIVIFVKLFGPFKSQFWESLQQIVSIH